MEVETETTTTTTEQINVTEILRNAKYINKSSASKDVKYTNRALKNFTSLRHKLTKDDLATSRSRIIPQAGAYPAIDALFPVTSSATSSGSPVSGAVAYLHLLVGVWLIDSQRPGEAYSLLLDVGNQVIKQVDNSSIDPLISKIFYFCSLSHEKVINDAKKNSGEKKSDDVTDDVMSKHENEEINFRNKMFAAYNFSGLRRLCEAKFTLLNILLRSYIQSSLYEQADLLISKAGRYADSDASLGLSIATLPSSQYARYFYYLGRIRSVQLDYAGAYDALQDALRKAPECATSASGFKVAVTKLLCIVQLLMGEIPERSTFAQKGMRGALRPYLLLAQAVRSGSVRGFLDVVGAHEEAFRRDGTLALVGRLRHNVIKAGLRKICSAYSRISLKDVAERLHIVPVEDCEFIVAKAIRDGAIDATIDHEGGWLASRETVDVYATKEPRNAYDKRIRFCFQVQSLARNSMVFAAGAHKPKPLQSKKRGKSVDEKEDEEKGKDEEYGDFFDDDDYFDDDDDGDYEY